MTNQEQSAKTQARIERFLKLHELNAPVGALAHEALTIAKAFYGRKGLLAMVIDEFVEDKILKIEDA